MSEWSKCIIVGSGEFSEEHFSYQDKDYLIAADGGYQYLKELNIVPHVIIGDFDSFKIENEMMSDKDCEIIKLPIEKDDTDMLAAIRLALSRNLNEIHIYGATGGRIDHTFANIQCLIYIKKHRAKGFIYDGDTVITMMENETLSFKGQKKGRMSLFAIDKEVTGVTLKGFQYPLRNATITNDFPVGVSNEFIGEPSEIEVKSGMVLVIYSK